VSVEREALTDAVAAVLADLLAALDGLEWAQRRLHPPWAARLVENLEPLLAPLEASLERIRTLGWPEHLLEDGARLERAAASAAEALRAFVAPTDGPSMADPSGVRGLYRALRRRLQAYESLYELCPVLVPASRFFLEESVRDSRDLVAALATALVAEAGPPVGVVHSGGEPGSRGASSLYVPEYWRPGCSWPLIVALHGGSGRGSDFLWSWVREARSRGLVVLAPTSRGDTWSLLAPEHDAEPLAQRVEQVITTYGIDRSRVLLTGMSDGGTFTPLAGLAESAPYTHLAPVSGVLAPLDEGQRQRLRGRPVYLVHGALDWMFSIQIARLARDELERMGADLVWREIEDLSHTYPRDENAAIIDWLDPGLAPGRVPLGLAGGE
jgi:phospholipase/carboxylesterase